MILGKLLIYTAGGAVGAAAATYIKYPYVYVLFTIGTGTAYVTQRAPGGKGKANYSTAAVSAIFGPLSNGLSEAGANQATQIAIMYPVSTAVINIFHKAIERLNDKKK